MRRRDAEALVDRAVHAWTAMNGRYVGILEVVHGSPWRGRVRITGVVEVAQHLHKGQPCRRGFRAGETIEVGGASIRPATHDETASGSYREVLRRTRAQWEARSAAATGGRTDWLPPQLVAALDAVIAAELRRLAGEPWVL